MTNDVIRMGYVSTYDAASGMCSVIYPDRNAETATSKMPVFLPFGIGQKLKKDDAVIVVHLSNGSEVGIVIGAFAQQGEASGTALVRASPRSREKDTATGSPPRAGSGTLTGSLTQEARLRLAATVSKK